MNYLLLSKSIVATTIICEYFNKLMCYYNKSPHIHDGVMLTCSSSNGSRMCSCEGIHNPMNTCKIDIPNHIYTLAKTNPLKFTSQHLQSNNESYKWLAERILNNEIKLL